MAPRSLPRLAIAGLLTVCCTMLGGCGASMYPAKHHSDGGFPFARPSPTDDERSGYHEGGGSPGQATPLTNPTAEQQHGFAKLNEIRAQHGMPPLNLDAGLSAFALVGSQALADGGSPHGHFIATDGAAMAATGFCGGGGETQAPGWSGADPNATIDQILASMMAEGPGGGHHDAIVSTEFTRVGIGIVVNARGLFFTNDFSPACR